MVNEPEELNALSSYHKALVAAGAKVHVIEYFGSYQGDWWAKVTYEGKTGWVHDYYGSCSGCDSFEGTFGWNDDKDPGYLEKLSAFGKSYLDNILTTEEALAEAEKHSSWDLSADDMVAFIKKYQDES